MVTDTDLDAIPAFLRITAFERLEAWKGYIPPPTIVSAADHQTDLRTAQKEAAKAAAKEAYEKRKIKSANEAARSPTPNLDGMRWDPGAGKFVPDAYSRPIPARPTRRKARP